MSKIEIWKDIEEYGGRIQISNLGNIKSYKTNRNLKTVIKNSGYKKVSITFKTVSKTFMIHRLVAITFILNPENKPQVNHKDGNKLNNCIDNLEWVTSSENLKHAWDNGLHQAYQSRIVINNTMGIFYDSIKEAAKSINMPHWKLERRLKGEVKNDSDFILL